MSDQNNLMSEGNLSELDKFLKKMWENKILPNDIQNINDLLWNISSIDTLKSAVIDINVFLDHAVITEENKNYLNKILINIYIKITNLQDAKIVELQGAYSQKIKRAILFFASQISKHVGK